MGRGEGRNHKEDNRRGCSLRRRKGGIVFIREMVGEKERQRHYGEKRRNKAETLIRKEVGTITTASNTLISIMRKIGLIKAIVISTKMGTSYIGNRYNNNNNVTISMLINSDDKFNDTNNRTKLKQ